MSTGKLVVAVTGASGAIYAQRFLREAAKVYEEILLIMSEQAFQVASTELDMKLTRESFSTLAWLGGDYPHIRLLESRNYFTPPASGSFRHDGMVIVPCSMGTAGRIAHGISDDLVTRSADVCLKEGRKLVLVPRETPYNAIHLENMLRLAHAGARILPASPGFYHRPQTIGELVDHLCYRILDQFDIPHSSRTRWTGDEVKDQGR